MNDKNIISGVKTFAIESKVNSMILLKDTSELLRRFGQMEMREINDNQSNKFAIRSEADEIWMVIEGKAEITLVDQRVDSPTENLAMKINLNEENQQGVMVPFGVAYRLSSSSQAKLMRIATHADGTHDADREIGEEDLSAFISKL